MKTTVEIADDLLQQARDLAGKRGWNLRIVLSESLRDYLSRESYEAAKPFTLKHTVVAGKGLQKSELTFEQMLEIVNSGPK